MVERRWATYSFAGGSLEAPALVEVFPADDAVYMGHRRTIFNPIPLDQIVADILNDAAKGHRLCVPGIAERGVFLCAGLTPTREEIDAVLPRQEELFRKMIAHGDEIAQQERLWAITDDMRVACRWMREARDWTREYRPSDFKDCPRCGEKIKSTAKMCRYCNLDLGWSKMDPAVVAEAAKAQSPRLAQK